MSEDTQAPESTLALPERLTTRAAQPQSGLWWSVPFDGGEVGAGFTGFADHKDEAAANAFAAELVRRWNAEAKPHCLRCGSELHEAGTGWWACSTCDDAVDRGVLSVVPVSADVRELVEAVRRLEKSGLEGQCPVCRAHRHWDDCYVDALLKKHRHVNTGGALRNLMDRQEGA